MNNNGRAYLKRDGTHAETIFGLSAKRTSPFKSAGGGAQSSRLLAVEECGSAGSDCIIFSKYVDHRLKMSLQGRKKWVKRSGEREIVYNVYKFMKTESEVGITIPRSKVQKRVAEATRVSRRNLCIILKEGENVETGVTIAFTSPCKLRPEVCTKSILDNFDEAVLRRIVHNFFPSLRNNNQL